MAAMALKPHLVRADTIDLQSHENPSAKDHSRQPMQNGQHGYNHAGPHHVQALRHANQDAYRDQQTSPLLNDFNHSHLTPQNQQTMYDDGDDDDEDEDDEHPHNGINGSMHHDGEYGDQDDGNDSHDDDMDDDMLDKISSSPSIEDEDIDFEFVYALHTFVATVEGQANATKGDTMVLLDDSNSYWWLVRVVKDGSIGYLPAEHIETPTERLARLNKHRNIDLSAAMLGDNHEKSKNPLKKAIRRRNAKSVNFAPPTYYEPPEQQWSDSEDDEDAEEGDGETAEPTEDAEQQAQQTQSVQNSQQLNSVDEPQANAQKTTTIMRVASSESLQEEATSPIKTDMTPAPLQVGSQDAVNRSRNGVVRNTDSFFKDDSVETKKISLTPRLLRGDSEANTPVEPTQQQQQQQQLQQQAEIKQRLSLETSDKSSLEDKSKDPSKKKEKKGMLSGLFKRKDKTAKPAKFEADEPDRASEDSGRSPASFDSGETPERKPSKLQKAPPSNVSPKNSPIEPRPPQADFLAPPQRQQAPPAPAGPAPAPPSSPSLDTAPASKDSLTVDSHQGPGRFPSLNEKRSVFAPITTVLRSKTSNPEVGDGNSKPIYSKRAKERFAIDDSESDNDDTSTPTAHSSMLHRSISPLPQDDSHSQLSGEAQPVSPIATSFEDRVPLGSQQGPSHEGADTSLSQTHQPQMADAAENAATPRSLVSPSTATTQSKSPPSATSMHTPSTSRSTPTWSDASLRTYMDRDSGQDIRDLLVIVHDKSNVVPVSNDHPLMAGLYTDERTRLIEMQSQLDGLLVGWLGKKGLVARAGA